MKLELSRYLFKVFYFGENYSGFQFQKNGKGVANSIEKAFREVSNISNLKEHNFKSSSRTDKSVNAIENIIQIDLKQEPSVFEINKALPDDNSIVFWAKAKVENSYQVRPSKSKTYSYYLPKASYNMKLSERAMQFIGKHDFKNFIRKDKAPRNTVCEIFEISFNFAENGVACIIKGDHFGWEMVRRMMGYLTDPNYFTSYPIDYLNSQKAKLNIRPASGKFLTLCSIELKNAVQWQISNLSYITKRETKIRKNKLEKEKYELTILSQFTKQFKK